MSSPGRRWFEQRADFVSTPSPASARTDGPDVVPDLFTRCRACGELTYTEAYDAGLCVCPACNHHSRLPADLRIGAFADEGTVTLHDENLRSVDRLGFVDSKRYTDRITQSITKVGRNDAFISASMEVEGIPLELGVMDFRFMGGSMGSVVGECITRLFERAAERGVPAIVVSASGGARMQEGVLSLMQMAKTCAALARLRDDAGMPYISVLTDPTTGGVAASFAMLGDVILAEPGALVGFAGARVIEQTIGESLPEGFQTAEYLLDHGMVDAIVSRGDMRSTVARVLRLMLGHPAPGPVELAEAVDDIADEAPADAP